MRLETFFAKFDQFADAPDAVAKMRELVLQLAVTGKLVAPSTNPDKHPAWVAFRKEISERVYSYDPGPPPPFGIPDHWEWCVLDEVAKPCGQKKPDEKFTYIDVGSIDNARGELKPELNTVEAADAPSRARKLAQPGSVIYATVRPYLKNIAVIEKDFSPPAIISTAFAILHPLPFVESRFLFYWLRSSAFEREVSAYAKGVAYPAISDGDLKGCAVPVPPPSEQKRIVAKVDELMALCDRLEAQQQERESRACGIARASLARFADVPTTANLNFIFHKSYAIPPADLRKSILTLAVQGKLVPQDPNDEPSEEIVRRAEAGQPDAVESPIDEAELPWSLPSCWTWVRLGTIANIKHGYAFSSESFTSEPTPYVLTTPGNFYEAGGFRDRGANTKYFYGEVPPSFMFNAGDLIIPMTEQAAGLLGSPAFIPDDGKTYLHNQRLGKMEFYSDEVLPSYVFWFFNGDFFRGELARTCTGMKVRHTSPKRILKVPFALPPLAEQRRIVAKVEQLMALVDALEQQLAASRATAANLLTALVAELTSASPATPSAGSEPVQPAEETKLPTKRPNRHFARAVLSAEIVHALHAEPTFGRVKHQKLFHLCEHIAQILEIEGQYHREAAGPLDNRLIYANEAELKRQRWYAETRRDSYGHIYQPLAKAGNHRRYLEDFWSDRLPVVTRIINLMRTWDTDRCEIFSTTYAAWNDLLIWGQDATEEAILHEILERWNPAKKRFPRERWLAAIQWMRDHSYSPTGFGKATAKPE